MNTKINPPTVEEIAQLKAELYPNGTKEVDWSSGVPGESSYVTLLTDGRVWDARHCIHWIVTLPSGRKEVVQAKSPSMACEVVVLRHPYGFEFVPEMIRFPEMERAMIALVEEMNKA